MGYLLHLLGVPRLETPQGELGFERKTAAVLAYLALEGQTPKYKLAGWLWPDSGETAARNNMRQLLRRLRLAGADVVEGEDRIALREDVVSDVAQLSSLDLEKVLELDSEAELLAGLDYDDTPDFAEWLFSMREELADLRLRAVQSEAERLEATGEYAGALELAQRAVRLEPLSEEAHRRIMRLFYLLGDRGSALSAFERCKAVLAEELGAEPLPETLKLAREIEQGLNLPKAVPSPKAVPLAMLHPPSLVGREREWAQLEEAWEKGQVIFVSSEPGVGKTRLTLDFAASKGPVLRLDGRPGDTGVPYATSTRNFRRILGHNPAVELPHWVRRELSRLLPELAEGELPPPLMSEADKLRFFEAKFEFVRLGCVGVASVVIDDVQYYDEASSEFGAYLFGRAFPFGGSGLPRFLETFRRAELPPMLENIVRRAVDAGVAAHIELEPLPAQALRALLESLELPGAGELAAPFARYTGGNPLFVLETVRHLHQTGQLGHGWPGRLPPPGKVGPLIQRRLERLSKPALSLTQAAAVLKNDFTFDLVCEAVGASPFEMASVWQELEAAQVMDGERFSHDLVFEAVEANLPEAVKRWLHRSAAGALERRGANPARVAGHWLEGGEPRRAVEPLLAAARAAQAAYRLIEAAELYGQAGSILEAQGETASAFEALAGQAELVMTSQFGEGLERLTQHLFTLATTPAQQAVAWKMEARRLRRLDDGPGYERAALEGHAHARRAGDPQLELDLLAEQAGALWIQNRVDEAAALQEDLLHKARLLSDPRRERAALAALAYLRTVQGRLEDSLALEHAALDLERKSGDLRAMLGVLNNLTYTLTQAGQTRQALRHAEEARSLLGRLEGEHYEHIRTLNFLSWIERDLYHYGPALEYLEQALEIARSRRLPVAFLHRSRATLELALGRPEEALAQLEAGLADPLVTADDRLALGMVQARLPQSGVGLEELERQIRATGRARPLVQFLVVKAGLRPDQAGLEASAEALGLIERHGLRGYEAAARTRQAAARLAQGQPGAALESVRAALDSLESLTPLDFQQGEILLVQFRVLEALHDPAAGQVLETARRWVLEVSEGIPPEYRQGFLQRNPTNRAILSGSSVWASYPSS